MAYDGAWATPFSTRESAAAASHGAPIGIIGVQLPEAREIDTRRRLFQLYPDARELRPPLNVEIAIEGIVALLRGQRRRSLRRQRST